jgi:UDP-N-acetylglucosamine 2-epimerase (non-hydrolysing)
MARSNRSQPLDVMLVLGTRPEVMKLAPVALELRAHPEQFRVTLVSTGQHRDLTPQYLRIFGLAPDADLKVMKHRQSLADITSRTIARLDALLRAQRPDVVMVQGDTTAVLAAGLTAFYHQIPVAHVEAGLRSYDRYDPFPEEMNRRLMSPLAQLNFAPTPQAKENLLRENVPPETIYVTGNTTIDALLFAAKQKVTRLGVPPAWIRGKRLLLVTAHRRENWETGIREICLALADLARAFPDVVVVYAVHPNPIVRETAEEVLAGVERVHLIAPPDYVEFVDLMRRSYLILTDSGGVQEEAPSLGKPILVLRKTTERPEGVAAGCARLVGARREDIVAQARELLTSEEAYRDMARRANPYGDGRAAARIWRALAYHFGRGRGRPADWGVGVES